MLSFCPLCFSQEACVLPPIYLFLDDLGADRPLPPQPRRVLASLLPLQQHPSTAHPEEVVVQKIDQSRNPRLMVCLGCLAMWLI